MAVCLVYCVHFFSALSFFVSAGIAEMFGAE